MNLGKFEKRYNTVAIYGWTSGQQKITNENKILK
jgi:hypothetical protein